MATKKRISELPICETFKGLFTIGVDALNHSVKVSLEFIDKTVTALKSSVDTAVKNAETATAEANKATEDCTTATEAANEATDECREIIETASSLEALGLFPTSMTLSYPENVTMGNKVAKINAVLHPDRVHQNVICLGDNNAISVTPDGRITTNKIGTSTVHVIPTCNMGLYKTILITVTGATARLVTKSSIRLTSNGNFRLN